MTRGCQAKFRDSSGRTIRMLKDLRKLFRGAKSTPYTIMIKKHYTGYMRELQQKHYEINRIVIVETKEQQRQNKEQIYAKA